LSPFSEAARKLDAVTFERFGILRARPWHERCDVFERHDALLCPTTARPAPAPGARDADSDADSDADDGRERYPGLDMTCPFHFVSPRPALSVPVGLSDAGVPVDMQTVGMQIVDMQIAGRQIAGRQIAGRQTVERRVDEPTVMRVGAAVERHIPAPVPAPQHVP